MEKLEPTFGLKQLFSRNFCTVTVTNFLVMITYYQIFVSSALFAKEHFNVALAQAGLSAGLMVVGCLIGRFIFGNLISQIGCAKVLIFGTLTFCLLTFAIFFLGSLSIMYAQRLIQGFFFGATLTATGTIMAYCVPSSIQGLGVSIFSLSTALALALGPFLGLFIVNFVNYDFLLKETTLLSVLAFLCSLVIKNPPTIPSTSKSLLKLSSYIEPKVVNFALIAALMSLGYGAISSFLGNFSQERHLETAASLFFCTSAFVTIITRPISGRFFDRFGENIVLYPAIIFTAIALLLLAIAQNSFLIILAGIFQGLGFGNFQSSGQALTLKLVSKERYAQASSTFFIFFDLGNGLSPYLFGLIAVALGFESMFYLLSALTLLTAVLYYFVHGKDHPLKMPLFKRRSKKHLSL